MSEHDKDCCKYAGIPRHRGCSPETCELCAACKQHALFKRMAEDRKLRGIKNKRFCIEANEANVASISEFYEEYIRILGGKQMAVDFLTHIMRYGFEVLRDKEKSLAKRKGQRSHRTRGRVPPRIEGFTQIPTGGHRCNRCGHVHHDLNPAQVPGN